MDLKGFMVDIFLAFKNDEKLLALLEVPSNSMKDVKKQILEDAFPSDFLEVKKPIISIFERPSMMSDYAIESGYVEIDIFVPKELDAIDRRILLIAQRVIEILNNAEFGLGFKFTGRLPNLPVNHPNWKRYGILFSYNKIFI